MRARLDAFSARVSSTSTPDVDDGMQEGDSFSLGADARRLVDEPNAVRAAALERAVEIVDGETDVMNARPAFGDELAIGESGDSASSSSTSDGPAARPAILAPSASSSGTSGRPSTSR